MESKVANQLSEVIYNNNKKERKNYESEIYINHSAEINITFPLNLMIIKN